MKQTLNDKAQTRLIPSWGPTVDDKLSTAMAGHWRTADNWTKCWCRRNGAERSTITSRTPSRSRQRVTFCRPSTSCDLASQKQTSNVYSSTKLFNRLSVKHWSSVWYDYDTIWYMALWSIATTILRQNGQQNFANNQKVAYQNCKPSNCAHLVERGGWGLFVFWSILW